MPEKKQQVDPANKSEVNPHNWVESYADYLYAYAMLRINDDEQARDLVQETFLAALQARGKFQGRSTEKTWLTSILKNKLIDVYRDLRKEPKKQIDLLELGQTDNDFFDPENGHWGDRHRPKELGIEQSSALENKEFELTLKACMEKLPKLWLAVFSAKHLEEQPTETICSELNLSPSNFWVITHRTKLSLRSCLEKNWI